MARVEIPEEGEAEVTMLKVPAPHPFADFIDPLHGYVEAPEFVVDNVLLAGTAVIAGERGLGKTSAVVPLVLCATGLMRDYPLKATIRRKVVYVAEDVGQVRRIIAALIRDGRLESEGLFGWFKLVEAKRLPARHIVGVVEYLDELYTNNERVDGTNYCAAPVMVMDTSNATIDLDNISDNSEVSNAVSTLRQGFGDIPLLLMGHVAKASRSDAQKLSFVGAGSWEGDTQQALYLTYENEMRYLVMGKKRFEPDATEFLIRSFCAEFDATDKLGNVVQMKCFYGVPEPTSKEAKADAMKERQAENKRATWSRIQSDVVDFLKANPKSSKTVIRQSISGNNAQISAAIQELENQGDITAIAGNNGGSLYSAAFGTSHQKSTGNWP